MKKATRRHSARVKPSQQRKCKYCGQLFELDYRNRRRQEFCSKSECARASHRLSQQRWLAKPENRDVFKGVENVNRVRAWRAAHPGYWKKKGGALQDSCSLQQTASQPVTQANNALQDLCLLRNPLFIGLLAHLAGALQEDTEKLAEKIQIYGQTILAKGPDREATGRGTGTEADAKAEANVTSAA